MTPLTLRRAAMIFLCLGGSLALGACGTTHPAADQTPQQSQVQKARQLCLDLGYKADSPGFAQCAQSEYDRLTTASASAAAPTRSSDSALENWFHKPAICSQRSCTGGW